MKNPFTTHKQTFADSLTVALIANQRDAAASRQAANDKRRKSGTPMLANCAYCRPPVSLVQQYPGDDTAFCPQCRQPHTLKGEPK